jgi:hypothetical protein
MRLLAALLIVTAVAAFGYAALLILAPSLLRDISAAPGEDAWLRYQVPLYVGLGIVSLAATRDPIRSGGVVWGIAAVWAGLFVVLVVNLATGDEHWTILAIFRLVFDPGMAMALAATQVMRRS